MTKIQYEHISLKVKKDLIIMSPIKNTPQMFILKMHNFKLEFSTNKSDSSSTPGLDKLCHFLHANQPPF